VIPVGADGTRGRLESQLCSPDTAAEWAAARATNTYHDTNPRMPGAEKKVKARKADVRAAVLLYAEIDKRVDETKEGAEARILTRLQNHNPPPSCVIASGSGGCHAYWFLDKPIEINGDEAKADEVALYNKKLATDLDGDKCIDVCRLLRVPFTDYIPDAAKQRLGRVNGRTSILQFNETRRYPLSAFTRAVDDRLKGVAEKRLGATPAQLNGSIESIHDERIAHLPLRAKDVMQYGEDPRYVPKEGDDKDTSRSGWLFDFVCEARRAGIPDDVIAKIITDPRWKVSACVLDKPDVRREVERVLARATEVGHPPDPRPVVIYDELHLSLMFDKIERGLVSMGALIFDRGGQLVQVYRQGEATVEDGVRRNDGALTIRTVPTTRLIEIIQDNVRLRKHTKGKGDADMVPPMMVATHIAARGDRRQLRELRGTIETPILRPDGTILSIPGYDSATKLFLDTGGLHYPDIPESPTIEDARAALAVLKEPYRGFPFKPEEEDVEPGPDTHSPSRSVALSSLMTAVVAPLLRAAPLHGFTAPTMSSGKTLCANVAAMAVTGREAAMMSQGADEEEDEKRLVGVIARGDVLLLIDNIRRPVTGDLLCQVITERTVQVRMLGATGQVHLPASTFIMATGNNLQVAGDMATRAIFSTIDTGLEHPEERSFAMDLKTWVPDHRAELVAAALTLMRAYVLAGRPWPKDAKPFNRFEDWDRTVRGALLWLGEPDPCATRVDAAAMDPVRDGLAMVLSAMRSHPGLSDGQPFSAQDVVTHTRTSGDLADALACVVPGGVVTAKAVSNWLKNYKGRVVDGWKIDAYRDTHAKAMRFRLMAAKAKEQGELPI
jgi:hypothetical protein